MKIRAAEPADRDRIREILVSTLRFTPAEVGWAMELVDAAVAHHTEDRAAVAEPGEYSCFVLDDPGSGPQRAVQGYTLYGPTPKAEGVYDLYWIAVDPKQQGRGIGQLLLRFVENEVRRQNGRMLLIETSSKASYAPTIRFYQRSGYEEISRIKDFYRIEDDKVVFCKKLPARPER
jgi:ribosomal protein S18 acetylase RimI-like enzyme